MTAADLAGARQDSRAGGERRAHWSSTSFQPGVSVLHPEYGLGRIVAIEGAGSGRKGRVAFAVGPARTFVLAKSPLRPVARPAQPSEPLTCARPDDSGVPDT